MDNTITPCGPAVEVEQLLDIYHATKHEPSPWQVISDQVMGGVSHATLHTEPRHGAAASCLVGRTHLDNNGGFVQMKLDIKPSELHAHYKGLFIELAGTAHDYNIHVKTAQLTRPWQSFRCTLSVVPEWTRFIIPYSQLLAHRTEEALRPADIQSVAVVAIGEAFAVEVCVRRCGFFI